MPKSLLISEKLLYNSTKVPLIRLWHQGDLSIFAARGIRALAGPVYCASPAMAGCAGVFPFLFFFFLPPWAMLSMTE